MSSAPEPRGERFPLRNTDDVVRARQAVRGRAVGLGFSIVEQTKLVTAASELARNTVIHGGGGDLWLEEVQDRGRRGVRLSFVDEGPGIASIELAMKDGYTSGGGLGHGLGGAKRLVNEFSIDSRAGEGTRVTITKWK